ncbi:hypothetical protein IWW38_003063, partial [Coemansia aciculifera]
RGEQLEGIPTSQLFDMLIEAHAPMGKQLRRLLVWYIGNTIKEILEFVVLLTTLCPNLCFIDGSHHRSELFSQFIEEYADLPPFQKYEKVLHLMCTF